MAKLTYAQYVTLMRDDYFGGVMREDRAGVWNCFTDDARVTIYHGDNEVRQFHKNPGPGQKSFDFFYGHLWQNYKVLFENYRWIVDVENEWAAATFLPTLDPKPGSEATEQMKLNNCNFFWFRGNAIADMIIYYANPTLGAKVGAGAPTPTAFPKG